MNKARPVLSAKARFVLSVATALLAACALGSLLAARMPVEAAQGPSAEVLSAISGTATVRPTVKPSITPTSVPMPASAGAQRASSTSGVIDIVDTVNTGSGNNAFAYDGDVITFTLSLVNNSSTIVNNILLLDLLPQDALDKDSISCSAGCQKIFDTQNVPQPIGGSIVVTITRQISWTIDSLAPGASVQKTFSGKLAGQADGAVVVNRAFVSCVSANCNAEGDATITARVRPVQPNGPSLSAAATWFSNDLGGTISQDWADYDRDGNLDLALASSIGTSVYHNNNGKLEKLWSNTRQTFGVVWGDFANDGTLRIVAVGDSADKSPATQGMNYIYTRSGNDFVQTGVFTSEYQLVRVVAGVLGGNGNNLDLIASTNTLNSPCPVQVFRNDGTGNFPLNRRECLSTSATAAIGLGDFNNDGYPDVVVGQFPNTVRLYV
ncbi:MAG: VCBS repeat-containing protein, partial [Chloroflexi bacterium]|nr:VCBS repeat-containing protein [Chloroflexota bacterium]